MGAPDPTAAPRDNLTARTFAAITAPINQNPGGGSRFWFTLPQPSH
ncbi:hypothetical protein [Actinoplanes sp. DH11]|nr:hypothetical protein [Actinoplanes sp. DH11]